jgi:hypothetical protein
MITQPKLDSLKTWFKNYVASFSLVHDDQKYNFNLKNEHTARVCQEIIDVAKSLKLPEDDVRLAEACALLHDLGRFEQYFRYRTFRDHKSEDHGLLGVRIIREQKILDDTDPASRELIIKAVTYHNRAAVPADETERVLIFSRLVRDADKLDIGRIYADYYSDKNRVRQPTLELELPDTGQITEEIYQDILAGKRINHATIKTLTDLRLIQMSLVYDINFPRSLELVRQRGYLEVFYLSLPQTEKMKKVYEQLKNYLEKRSEEKEWMPDRPVPERFYRGNIRA